MLVLAATTGYQTRAFEEAAAQLGVHLQYATDRCHVLEDPWRDAAIAVRFDRPRQSVDAIAASAQDLPIHGILAVGDQPTLVAAHAAERLGLPFHHPDGAAASRNKLAARARLHGAGLPIPDFRAVAHAVDPATLTEVTFPCVVKPLGLSASRGVIRANNRAELAAAVLRVRGLLDSLARGDVRDRAEAADTVLIEEFIPGREFAVEGVMSGGALQVLAIFDKPDPLDGPFFEETIYLTPSAASAAVQTAIAATIEAAAKALHLEHGPVHAECRINDVGVFVLEVAARPIGGLCARALRFVSRGRRGRLSLESVLLRHALGEPVHAFRRESVASGVMMIPIPRRGVLRRVSGHDRARAVAHVTDVRITAKIDQLLVPLPEGASYLGFIFASAARPAAVDRALRLAHAELDFAIDPELRMVQSGHG